MLEQSKKELESILRNEDLSKGKKETMLRDFRKAHVTELANDTKTMDLDTVLKNWHINKKGWRKIEESLGIGREGEGVPEEVKEKISREIDMSHALDIDDLIDKFPDFNDEWGDEVKLAWFRVYESILTYM